LGRPVDFETRVKLAVYETIAKTAKVPASTDVAKSLGAPVEDVEKAFADLAGKRLLVLEPGDRSRIRMAPPFSGIGTVFRVEIGKRSYDANCVWDALGVAAALHSDAIVRAADGHDGSPMTLEVRDGAPVPQECAIHFAVPAARWWENIIET
jgi:hypothetical protein